MDGIFAVLFDPNLVYLGLVLGFMLMIIAVISPGTGVVEVLAFFAILYAGYGVFTMADEVNFGAIGLLIIGVIPFLFALRKSRRMVYLALALVVLTIGSAYLFRGDAWWKPRLNLPLVVLVSVLNASFLWLVASKSLDANLIRPAQDLQRLIGETGQAETSVHDSGTVQVLSELWSARSHTPIPKGQEVRVIGREGFILEVEPTGKPDLPASSTGASLPEA